MCNKSRQLYVWLLLFLLLMLMASTGCHRSQDVARKPKAPHPPTAGEGTHTAGGATAAHPGTSAGNQTSMRGAAMSGGGTVGEGGIKIDLPKKATPGGDLLGQKSGGGGPGLHARPPGGDQQQQQQQMQVVSGDTSGGGPAKKGAKKAHETPVSMTTTTTTPADPDQVLQNAVDALPVGKVLFNHPSEMKMGEAKEVQVRIARDVATDISTGLTTPGTATKDQITEQQQIKVSTSMKVQLHGEPYFDVKPLTDEEQLISKTGFTEWKFTVIPLQGGKWPLHLTVTAVVHAADREKVKNLEVLDEQVTVQVSAMEVVEAFIGNNWQWLIGTIFIPVGAWLLPKLKKKKSRAAAA